MSAVSSFASTALGSSRPPRLPRSGGLSAVVWLVAALFFVTPASASQVYYSPNDDGLPAAGSAEVPPGLQSVYLYIDGGALASPIGTACDTGSGNEICGYTLTLTGLTGLTLAGFHPGCQRRPAA